MEALIAHLPPWVEVLQIQVLGRLSLALALGALIGLERELSGKPAGLRTNILICVGAALLTEASVYAASNFAGHELIRADPGRIAAGIVTGIGFIGAGTIIVWRGTVTGLTTAATLWVVAAIGMMVGFRAYVVAVGSTVLVLLTLVVLGKVEKRLLSATAHLVLTVELGDGGADATVVEALLGELGVRCYRLGFTRGRDARRLVYGLEGTPRRNAELVRRLEEIPDIRSARIE
ncbi:MAG: MgtC/SapB family protein [Gemmatimonadota bacterium]